MLATTATAALLACLLAVFASQAAAQSASLCALGTRLPDAPVGSRGHLPPLVCVLVAQLFDVLLCQQSVL